VFFHGEETPPRELSNVARGNIPQALMSSSASMYDVRSAREWGREQADRRVPVFGPPEGGHVMSAGTRPLLSQGLSSQPTIGAHPSASRRRGRARGND
jgi:hypothetical protein